MVRLVGQRIGVLPCGGQDALDVDASFKNSPSALFDAAVIPDGESVVDTLCGDGLALEFVRDQYRHGKPMLALGEGLRLLEQAGIPPDEPDDGLVLAEEAGQDGIEAFVKAIEQHRHPIRESDPPAV